MIFDQQETAVVLHLELCHIAFGGSQPGQGANAISEIGMVFQSLAVACHPGFLPRLDMAQNFERSCGVNGKACRCSSHLPASHGPAAPPNIAPSITQPKHTSLLCLTVLRGRDCSTRGDCPIAGRATSDICARELSVSACGRFFYRPSRC
jgi:hypothetical protein